MCSIPSWLHSLGGSASSPACQQRQNQKSGVSEWLFPLEKEARRSSGDGSPSAKGQPPKIALSSCVGGCGYPPAGKRTECLKASNDRMKLVLGPWRSHPHHGANHIPLRSQFSADPGWDLTGVCPRSCQKELSLPTTLGWEVATAKGNCPLEMLLCPHCGGCGWAVTRRESPQRILSLEPFPADKPHIQGKPGQEGILSRALPPTPLYPPHPHPALISHSKHSFSHTKGFPH